PRERKAEEIDAFRVFELLRLSVATPDRRSTSERTGRERQRVQAHGRDPTSSTGASEQTSYGHEYRLSRVPQGTSPTENPQARLDAAPSCRPPPGSPSPPRRSVSPPRWCSSRSARRRVRAVRASRRRRKESVPR